MKEAVPLIGYCHWCLLKGPCFWKVSIMKSWQNQRGKPIALDYTYHLFPKTGRSIPNLDIEIFTWTRERRESPADGARERPATSQVRESWEPAQSCNFTQSQFAFQTPLCFFTFNLLSILDKLAPLGKAKIGTVQNIISSRIWSLCLGNRIREW